MKVEAPSKQAQRLYSVKFADQLRQFNIKNCFVQLDSLDIDFSAMETTKRKAGRASKANTAATAPATKSASDEAPASPVTPAEKATTKKAGGRKSAAAALAAENAALASSGRGKRTPKPNPKYMNDTVISTTKVTIKDDSTESETADEDIDELLSSDEYRAEGPLKKRPILKSSPKSTQGKLATTGKKTPIITKAGVQPGRRSGLSMAAKRKLAEAEIDIDDDHGKQLFLAAKRRLTHVSETIMLKSLISSWF